MAYGTCRVCGGKFYFDSVRADRKGRRPEVCPSGHPLLNIIRARQGPQAFFRCPRGHVSRPLLYSPVTPEANIVVCTGRTKKGKACGEMFLVFERQKAVTKRF